MVWRGERGLGREARREGESCTGEVGSHWLCGVREWLLDGVAVPFALLCTRRAEEGGLWVGVGSRRRDFVVDMYADCFLQSVE